MTATVSTYRQDMRVNEADLEWWTNLVPTLHWTFAKTMADIPHSYVVRDKDLGYDEFMRAVRVIRTFGQPGKFYSATNIYLTVGNQKWWTMGAPLEDTIIINTATTDNVYGTQDAPSTYSGVPNVYDTLATGYDSRYMSPDALSEDEHIRKMLVHHFGASAPTTLDVGCGTGLLLDMGIPAKTLYTGIDPSQGMLNELIRKHPKVKDVRPGLFEDWLPVERLNRYELVASLFGSASYLHPDSILAMPDLSSDLLVLMNYVEGYLPDYHQDDPVIMQQSTDARQAARQVAERHGGVLSHLNKFQIVMVR